MIRPLSEWVKGLEFSVIVAFEDGDGAVGAGSPAGVERRGEGGGVEVERVKAINFKFGDLILFLITKGDL